MMARVGRKALTSIHPVGIEESDARQAGNDVGEDLKQAVRAAVAHRAAPLSPMSQALMEIAITMAKRSSPSPSLRRTGPDRRAGRRSS